MSIVRETATLITFAVFFLAPHCQVLAGESNGQESLASWKVLKGEPSRADLFKRIIEARREEDAKLSDGSSKTLGLKGPFTFPKDVGFDDVLGKPRTNSIFGIDISHHTKDGLKIGLLRQQGVRFVYAKATQGVGFKDGKFAGYWKELADLPESKHVFRGAYHFLSSSSPGAAQADSFVRFMKANGGFRPTDLPPVVDLEWDITDKSRRDRWSDSQPDDILRNVLDWVQAVESASQKKPIIYTARSWWRERIGSDEKFAKLNGYKIWIADYSRSARAIEEPGVPGNSKYHLWQFTDGSKLPSVYPSSLDANIYKGSETEFATDFQLKETAKRND